MSKKKTHHREGAKSAKNVAQSPSAVIDGPYVVEGEDLKNDKTGELIEAFHIRGPRFPGLTFCGADGEEKLKLLAKRMNLAFTAGLEIGRSDAKRKAGKR